MAAVPVDAPAELAAEPAFGAPGLPPTWAPAAKQGLGTAAGDAPTPTSPAAPLLASAPASPPASPLWFTLAQGVVTEVYYPRVDVPNTRDLQFLVLLPGGEVLEERVDLDAEVELTDPGALAYHVTSRDRARRFELEKYIVADPARPALAIQAQWRSRGRGSGGGTGGARLFVLLAPHLAGHGAGNSARVVNYRGRTLITAWRHDAWLALGAAPSFLRASCGFAGQSDGWTDLHQNGDLRWRFGEALDGTVAVIGEIDGFRGAPFTVALGFGQSADEACAACVAVLEADFAALQAAYVEGWRRWTGGLDPQLAAQSGDGGRLYRHSAMILRAHADKENPGAHIASLAIPWGDAMGDNDAGGYHLVWPRDLYHSATARLAAGDAAGALQALRYLQRTQRADGSWPQNFWVFGEPYWRGLQLDELAFPILLAWQLERARALDFNPYPSLVAPAAYAVARIGPVTPEERWEENSGYSPSTLASAIAALVCAAEMAHDNRDPVAEAYFLSVADYWAAHIEEWTYTTRGNLLPGITEYYERIAAPVEGGPPGGRRDIVFIANLPGGGAFEARSIVGSGFLELVRYGVRAPDDPHILASLRAYDAACRVETPCGPAWHRYNHDGYGQKDDGGPYDGTGVGRAWPLLTGERAHYELAAGGDAGALRAALEAFGGPEAILAEQVWDSDDLPARGLRRGRPTGSAAPLCWAHAEYVKLLRSLRDGRVFDCPEPVAARYVRGGPRALPPDRWKFNHKIRHIAAGAGLCVEVYGPATVHWSTDGWHTVHHEPMEPRGHGVWVHNWPAGSLPPGGQVLFTFYWHEPRRWEGRDFSVGCRASAQG